MQLPARDPVPRVLPECLHLRMVTILIKYASGDVTETITADSSYRTAFNANLVMASLAEALTVNRTQRKMDVNANSVMARRDDKSSFGRPIIRGI